MQDQREVDTLNDDIRRLHQENKEAFSMRMNLEANKNKLENLLTNNLIRFLLILIAIQYICIIHVFFIFRRKEELVQALQEISVEDRKRQLANCGTDLAAAETRIDKVNQDLQSMESKLQKAVRAVSITFITFIIIF